MFASREPNFKRRLAGHVGGLLGASAMLLTVWPTIAAAAPAAPLTLASVCTLPDGNAVMRVGNPNAEPVDFTWDIAKTSFTGKGTAPPGDSALLVPSSTAGNTRVFVDGKRHAAKAQNARVCVTHVQPSKLWLDATGAPITSPKVPKEWALTLRSDLETVTCAWKKSGLACKSEIDEEDNGTFAKAGKTLEVPIGGSYTISETETPDFTQNGTGKLGPVFADLDAFVNGVDSFEAVVTNQSTVIEGATTTLAPVEDGEPTTTTTLVEDQEPTTTTTVVEDQEPTTTATLVEDQETTTTTSVVDDEQTTTTTVIDDEQTTTTAVPELTPTLAAEETTATTAHEPTTSTVAEPTVAEEATTTTVAEPTIASNTTVLAGERGTALDPPTGGSQSDPPAEVMAGADEADVLPVTGRGSAPVALLGVTLLAVGVCLALLGRPRLEV